MPSIRFDATISMGSIMSSVTVVLMVAGSYVAVKSELASDLAQLAMHERRLTQLEAERERDSRDVSDQRVQLNGRLTGLETNMLTLLQSVQELRRAPSMGPR